MATLTGVHRTVHMCNKGCQVATRAVLANTSQATMRSTDGNAAHRLLATGGESKRVLARD